MAGGRTAALIALAACAMLAGCSTAPAPRRDAPPTEVRSIPSTSAATAAAGLALLQAAESLIGTPYRYGGADPRGFDCSGLVQFIHRRAGLDVPRTAAAQGRAARPVARVALSVGDLVFFRAPSGAVDHVGIYAGDGRFVHAPGSGRHVSYGRLDDPWYAARFAGAGRFWTPDAMPASRPLR